jgi:hypothetical protein
MFKGFFSMYAHCENTFLWSVQPLPLLSLTLLSHTLHFSTAFDTHPYILYLYRRYVLWYYWSSIILFSFPSSPSSINQFHCYKHVLHMSLYMIVFVFVYMFVFWIYLPHMRENMWPLSLWTWLTSLNMMSSSCIHLPSNYLSLFLMSE